jgi:DnaA family protein
MPEQYPLHFEFRANQTFDDFFAGGNQPIVDELKQCVSGHNTQQIFLWGKSKQGKSHLLQACCHYAQHHKHSSFYFDLARYSGHKPSILLGLDDYDVVCIDNIDSILGREKWEQALSDFMQRHYERGHRLIISATNLPSHTIIKTSDLKTRLSWGAIIQLKTLVNTSSVDALIFKAAAMGLEISPQVGRFLIIQHQAELDSLWGLLEKLDRASLAAKRKLTVPFLKHLFNTELQKTKNHDG